MIALIYTAFALATLVIFRREILRALFLWGARRNPTNVQGRLFTTWRIYNDDGSDYLWRFYFPRFFGFRPLLHWLRSSDQDRDLHDHPWTWAFSLILAGSYEEQRLPDAWHLMRRIPARDWPCAWFDEVHWFNVLRSGEFHKITELHGDVFTLFLAGPRTPEDAWGFLTEDGFVHHTKYKPERRRVA